MITERIRKIRDISADLDQVLKYIPFQKITYVPDPADSIMVRFQKAFESVMDQAGVNHIPGSRIAGNGGEKFYARPAYLVESEIKEMQDYPKRCREEILESINEEMFYILPYNAGHVIEDIPTTLQEGISGITDRITGRLEDPSLNEHQREFLQVSLAEWNAVRRLVKRHIDYYEKLAEETADEAQKQEYLDIAQTLREVPEHPAKSFRQALQSVWLVYYCSQMDDVANHSLGRLDQYLIEYYRRDLENGVLTKEEAREFLYDFWLKYTAGYTVSEKMGRSSWKGVSEYSEDAHDGLYWLVTKIIDDRHVDDGQTVNLSGMDEYGNDATNELSWMMLEAVQDLNSIEPKPVVKFSEKTDPAFREFCFKMLATGNGFPAVAYDRTCIKALKAEPGNHYSEKDVIDNCHIGCIEPAVPGKAYVDPMSAFINLSKVFSVTMNQGSVYGKKIGLALPQAQSWEEFLQAYLRQMDHFIDLYVEGTNQANPFFNHYLFRPITSTLVGGCIDKALPVDEGGAVHWSKSINCCGLATAADSLMAVKQIVFDKKLKTLDEFNDILNRNFEGEEKFRQMLLNRVPRYGNGDAEVDGIVSRIVEEYCAHVYSCRTHNGSYYRPGLYSFYATVRRQGSVTPATADGRRRGEPVSLNIAPGHGSIRSGLTGALKSITGFDHSLAANACPIDVQLSGNTPWQVIGYISDYIEERGGMLLQVTVADRTDLLAAQKEPESYKDLIVRVTGFSARFVALDKETQNEILQRSYWA